MVTVEKIKGILKRKREDILFDLYLKDYDSGNYYFALVFNRKIKKYRVLYVPIDFIKSIWSIEEYFCYQFIFLHTVNFMLETINHYEDKYKEENFRLRCNPNMESYYIEFNTYVNGKNYKFNFTQYINKELFFFFDLFVTLFDHSPKIVNEICDKLLYEFRESNEAVRYNCCYEFDLRNNLRDLFSRNVIRRKKYSFDDIEFIERIGYRHYMILNNEIFIIDYDSFKFSLNVYSGNYDSLGDEIYIFVKAIQNGIEKKLNRIRVVDEVEDFDKTDEDVFSYYLCYGIDKGIEEDNLKIINFSSDHLLSIDNLKKKLIKVDYCNDKFKKEIKAYLNDIYEKDRVKELMNFIFE